MEIPASVGKCGCAFCGDISGKLAPGDLKSIQPLLTSTTLDMAFVLGLRETSSVFCDECHNLLMETTRLHELLQTVTAQLDFLLAKVKAKYEESRSVWVKVEEDSLQCESPEANQIGFSIDPADEEEEESVWVKEEEQSDDKSEDEFWVESELPEGQLVEIPPSKGNKRQAEKKSHVTAKKAKRRRKAKGFPCSWCDVSFLTKEQKFLHDETVHFEAASEDVEGATRLYSRICGKSSMTPRDLTSHNAAFHEAQLKFLCASCKPLRKFFSRDLLTAHKVIHSSSTTGNFPCSLCVPKSLTFSSPADLDNHLLRFHTHSLTFPIDREAWRVGKECDNPPNRGGMKISLCRFCGIHVKQTGLFGLRLHERKEHAEKFTHLCSHASCRSTFAEEKEVRTCQETHRESPGLFKCFVCNAKFVDGATLREHFEAKHVEGGVKCTDCSKRFANIFFLRIHTARSHGGEWPFKCSICGKGFESNSCLQDHLRSVHKGRPQGPSSSVLPATLQCGECTRSFASRGGLNVHKRKEHMGLLFTCEECGKVLKSPQTMEIHRKAHLGIKDHVCHTCGKAFVNPAVLTMHLRVHTGEKPYVCHVCQKGFSQHTPLQRHFDLHKKNGTWKEKPPKASSTSEQGLS